MKKTECITIDGPVASGKTTIGKELAKRIQYHFLDTGIMYRAVTYLALEKQINLNNEDLMVGRDIGTIVIPNAKNKFFLIASSQIRAQRRYKDFKKQGINLSLELVKSEIENRDKIDTQRKESPLEPAHDAIQINSDDMNIDQVIELMLNNIEKNK